MPGPSTIYFVRHGECKANVEEKNLPHKIDVITDKGKLQASLLGKHFQDVVFTKAYCSSYSRAQDTAKEILAQLKTPQPEFITDKRIRERELGDFENRPSTDLFDALFAAAKEKGTKLVDFEVPNGEPVQQLESRIDSFLEDLFKLIHESAEPQTILVVTHGVIIMRTMLKLRIWSKDPSKPVTVSPFSQTASVVPVKNTAYHALTVNALTENGTRKTLIDVSKLHESSHLDPLKAKVPVPPTGAMEEITKTWMEITSEQCAMV